MKDRQSSPPVLPNPFYLKAVGIDSFSTPKKKKEKLNNLKERRAMEAMHQTAVAPPQWRTWRG
jgi:hypothetical protein